MMSVSVAALHAVFENERTKCLTVMWLNSGLTCNRVPAQDE